ncbi:MAG: GtrA family protein [bacterium]
MTLTKFIDNIFDILLPQKTSKGMRQFLKYLVCGGMATLSDMAVLYVLTHFTSLNHLVAAAFGFVVGVTTNYSLNKILVFQSSGKIKKELPLFVFIGVGGLAWTEVILWIFVDHFNFKIMIAKMIAVVLVLNWNFFMRKKFVFSSEPNIETLEKGLE